MTNNDNPTPTDHAVYQSEDFELAEIDALSWSKKRKLHIESEQTVSDDTKLNNHLPCPFCSGNFIDTYDPDDYAGCVAYCTDCGTETRVINQPKPQTPAAALKVWNTRPTPAPVVEVTEKCTWTEDEDGAYDGTCGVRWNFDGGNVEQNGVKFCPSCGKSVVVAIGVKL
jgi:hypothetical protein